MGTDIHPTVEMRPHQDGLWQEVGLGPSRDRNPLPILTDRNYDVFAVLGNVRNGTGFGGHIRSNPVPYISDSRGLPDDRHDAQASSDDEWKYGDHSFSWVTLRELNAYDWDQTQVHVVVMPGEFFLYWRAQRPDRRGFPHDLVNDWLATFGDVSASPFGLLCGAIHGQGIVTLPEPVFLEQHAAGTLPAPLTSVLEPSRGHAPTRRWSLYVETTYLTSIREACQDFCDTVLPWLNDLRADNPGASEDDIRIVFGFDS